MVAKTSYEKGRQEGRQEERQEELFDLLKRLLPKRFGAVLDAVWTKIEAMSNEQRRQLVENYTRAESLEQLGLGREP
jgi:hypothetical protein